MITKEELYELYVNQNLGSKKISKIKNIGATTVLNYLKKYNIPKKTSGRQIKYKANHNCFDKWSHDMAYCLGFISADGHVWDKRPYITIAIHKKDIQILDFIKNYISPESKIRHYTKKDMIQICIHSKKIHKRLVSLGINNKKTLNIKMPKMSKKYIPDFIRGYFDGDGCIWRTKNQNYYYSNIISMSINIIQDINNYLGFGRIRQKKTSKGKSYYELIFCQSDTLKLKKIIYKDPNSIKLDRKYQKFLLIKEAS
jgi:hypothetical protein